MPTITSANVNAEVRRTPQAEFAAALKLCRVRQHWPAKFVLMNTTSSHLAALIPIPCQLKMHFFHDYQCQLAKAVAIHQILQVSGKLRTEKFGGG